jgi:hypothetical protein
MFADLSDDEVDSLRHAVEIIGSRVELTDAASAALRGSTD